MFDSALNQVFFRFLYNSCDTANFSGVSVSHELCFHKTSDIRKYLSSDYSAAIRLTSPVEASSWM